MSEQTVTEPADTGASPSTAAGSTLGRDALVVLGTFLALGLVGALLWWLLVDPAIFTRASDGGLTMGELELGKRFNPDGWYSVIAAVAGLLAGAALTWWRSRDPLATTMLVVAGSALAAAVMAAVGRLLGSPDPEAAAVHAAAGAHLPATLEVGAPVCYLVWPMAALLGALVVLWSPPAQSDS